MVFTSEILGFGRKESNQREIKKKIDFFFFFLNFSRFVFKSNAQWNFLFIFFFYLTIVVNLFKICTRYFPTSTLLFLDKNENAF